MNRIKGIIIAISMFIGFSLFYDMLVDIRFVSVIWSLFPYSAFALGSYHSSRYYVDKSKNQKIIMLSMCCFFAMMICSFICSSELEHVVKIGAFIIEVFMALIIMILSYRLEKMYGAYEEEKIIINSENIIKVVNDKTNKNYNKARAVFIVPISLALYLIQCFVLPIICKINNASLQQIVTLYAITSIFILFSLIYRNKLFYYSRKTIIVKSTLEIGIFVVGSLLDMYYNVYLVINSKGVYTYYFGPYLIMSIGFAIFLLNSKNMMDCFNEK